MQTEYLVRVSVSSEKAKTAQRESGLTSCSSANFIAAAGRYPKWNGPKDTSYRGGIFILIITFPRDYPKHAPEVCFKTPIYHVNVNPQKSNQPGGEPLGHVCISTLNWWKPEYKMREVLTNIFGLFYMANPDSPYGLDRANELRYKRALHEEKIKAFTKKYADPRYANIDKQYYDSWDFSYP